MSILSHVNISNKIILALIITLSFSTGVFAASWETESTSNTETGTTTEKDEGTETEAGKAIEAKKEKIKQEVSSYIIESYKIQWDKILKDIDQTLLKSVPNKDDRIEAYTKIQSSLEGRRTRNNNSSKISETSKVIIEAFLTHMIDSIEKKVADLK